MEEAWSYLPYGLAANTRMQAYSYAQERKLLRSRSPIFAKPYLKTTWIALKLDQ